MPRYAQLLVSTDLIGGWILAGSSGFAPVKDHLPPDTRLAGAYNAHPGVLGLIFESAAFPEAEKGQDAAFLPMLASPTYMATGPAACPPRRLEPSIN